jgi:dTDP-4-amino-4,6-dideoxygalactose transaminase
MSVPMLDPRRTYLAMKEDIDRRVQDVAASGRYVLGENVSAFEREVTDFLGVKHAVSVASGTDALHLSLVASGIGPGDEVITTPFSFASTVESIAYVGAKAILIDIDDESLNIDPNLIEAAITPDTKAIMPVHLFGLPADMDRIMAIAEGHRLEVIEDCAQSMGARTKGRSTGSIGTAGAFSFYPSKTLGCFGDGGMVTTNSDELAGRLRQLRNHGQGKSYEHEMVGFNSRLDEIQAAILRLKLPLLEQNNARRCQIAAHYNKALASTPARTPAPVDEGSHIYGYYTICVENRDKLRKALEARGIGSAVYYHMPLHRHDCYAAFCRHGSLEITERIARDCISLPIFPEMTDAEVEYVAETTAELIREN